jgi:hypothetical protein
LLLFPVAAAAQDTAPAQTPLAVTVADSAQPLAIYVDCEVSGCDWDYLRTTFTLVDYVRDPAQADVQVVSSALATGSGGHQVTLKFIGRREFTGVDDEINFTTRQDASRDERRQAFTRMLELGLTRYLLHTPAKRRLVFDTTAITAAAAPVQTVHDPWNAWVFGIGLSASIDGEAQSKSNQIRADFSADRITAGWKTQFYFSGNRNVSTYNLGDSSTYHARTHRYHASGLLVRSLGPHLSAGVTADASSSSQQNTDFRGRVAPAVEYDFIPYDAYTRKRLVLDYSVGLNRFAYSDSTIYDKLHETLVDQQLSLSYSTRQPWGNAQVSISAANYLEDFAHKFHESVDGNLSIRLVQGLELSVDGSYSRVHDQVYLAKGGASDQEILLRLRQLRTSYQYSMYFGLDYTFGSVFNNVVNPRMDDY